ncbi:hypothetical protein KSS87_001188 [Heliosperma pusillum]|nr:hypothetical protein KSS87_001188 [Heliosperma pusillum]
MVWGAHFSAGMLSEQLVYYNRHAALTRANMPTMLPDVGLCDAVIECWSMLMNRLETDEYDFQRMSFFGIGHMAFNVLLHYVNGITFIAIVTVILIICYFKAVSVLLQGYLLFVPFNIEGHFACVYFKSKAGTVDLLDHQLHPDLNKSKICKLASLIGSTLSDYLESKGIDRGSEMVMFEHRQIKFPWQSSSPNLPESGLFTMMHMLMYDGNPFDNEDLRRKISRRYLVFQLTAALILADINTIPDEVVGKVNQFLV